MNEKSAYSIWDYTTLAASIAGVFILASWFKLNNRVNVVHIVMVMSMAAVITYGVVCYRNNKLNLIKIIIILGFIMRIGYMLYTPVTVRSYDFYSINEVNHDHGSYIINLLNNKLPSDNLGQYYHPPFFYIVASAVVKLVNIFVGSNNIETAIEASKIVSCFASCAIILMVFSICKNIKMGKRGTMVTLTFIAFSPQFYLLAGRVNNDSLATFFMVLIILYLIKWYQSPTIKNIAIIAIGFGLGMMTKISVAILAFVCGPIMIYKFVMMLKKKQYTLLAKSSGIFAVISFPLGLWYLFRNFIKFNQSFTYVLEPAKNGVIYVGNYNMAQRFFGFDFTKLFSPIFNHPYDDYNIPMYLLKGGLFGEFELNIPRIIAQIFIVIWTIMIVILLIAMVVSILKSKKSMIYRIIMPFTLLVVIISYIVFNIKLPYGCSMDFRYLAVILVIQGIMLGRAVDVFDNNREKSKSYRMLMKITSASLIVFSVVSVITYCLLTNG